MRQVKYSLLAFIVLAAIAGVSAALLGSVVIVSPANDSYANGTLAIHLTFNGTANITIEYNTTAEYTLSNSSNDSASPFVFNWDTTGVSDGIYNLQLNVTNSSDAADNDTLHVSNITIDNTAPVLTFQTPAVNTRYKDGQSIVVNVTVRDATAGLVSGQSCLPRIAGSDAGFTGTVTILTLNLTDGYCNGTLVLDADSGIADGTHALSMNTTDQAGNTNTASQNIVIDNTAPAVTGFVANASYRRSDASMQFNVTVTDSGSGSSMTNVSVSSSTGAGMSNMTSLGGNLFQYNATPANFGCTSDGACVLNITAKDDLNNTNDTVQLTITVDGTAPALVLNSPADEYASAAANVSFNLTVSEASTANSTLYINGTANQSASGNGTFILSSLFADGDYSWYVNSTDNASNTNASALRTFTVDTNTPGITNITNGSITSSGATIQWNVSEASNGSVNYGTTTSLGTASSNASMRLNHSISLSGLSASTLYYYNVTSCDAAGNCNVSGTYNVTTSAAATTSSSGRRGGGGGSVSSSVLSSTPRQHVVSESGFYNFQLGGSNYVHRLSIEEITPEQVTFVIRSDPVYVTLERGEYQDVDVDGDGIVDMRVELVSFTTSSATFKVHSITGPAPEPATEQPVVEEVAQPAQAEVAPAAPPAEPADVAPESETVAEPATQRWVWWAIVAAIVLVLAIVVSMRRRPPVAESTQSHEHAHHAPHHK